MFRIYLDNFDELRKVNRVLCDAVVGKVSPLALGLREEYTALQVPMHPKKSVQQQLVAEVQGAIINGEEGMVVPRHEKILRYC